MTKAQVQENGLTPQKTPAQPEWHILGPASGWAVTARFGQFGKCWDGSGPCLRVVAVNPRRGTGSSLEARLDLLQRAIKRTEEKGPSIYLTSAGFFGCVAPAGDQINFDWPGEFDVSDLDRRLGELAMRLPADTRLCVGVEPTSDDQWLWWYKGSVSSRFREIVQNCTEMQDRRIEVAGFRLLVFVCGELWDRHERGFNSARDTVGIDVVLDAAHGSINRVWDRVADPGRRWAFQRAFGHLGDVCGGMLAQAHEAGNDYVRRQDNWIVYKDELPFPDEVKVIEL